MRPPMPAKVGGSIAGTRIPTSWAPARPRPGRDPQVRRHRAHRPGSAGRRALGGYHRSMTDLASGSPATQAAARGPVDGLGLQLESYRVELTAYCYRMLGSAFEAEDA